MNLRKLIVRNKRILSEYFNIQLETKEDLYNRTEENVKNFIKTYENVLFNEDYCKLKEFTEETGLSVLRVYHVQNSYNEFYLDERGIFAKWENDYDILNDNCYIFKHHLTIHIYIDKIVNENNCIYGFIKNQKKLIYKENEEYSKVKYDGRTIRGLIHQEDLSKEDMIKKICMLLPKQVFTKLKIEQIKQIECIYPFEDILILKNNGELYVNGKLYAKNVRELCCLTSYRTYIIFENQNVELYTCTFIQSSSIIVNATKTLTVNESFIATLTDERDLFISTIGSDNCGSDFDYDNSIDFYLSDVDDFTYTYDFDNKVATLNLIVGGNKILFPLNIILRK